MSFDLNTLAKKETSEIVLLHPVTDEPLKDEKGALVKVVVYGTSSKQYRKKVLEMNNARIKRGKKTLTAEAIDAEAVELLVACSDKILNMKMDGEAIDSPEAFRKLYSNPALDWLREQIDNGIGDTSTFLAQQ